MNELTPEEIGTLKELAQTMQAGSKLSKVIRGALIWLSTSLGAGYIIWEFILKVK